MTQIAIVGMILKQLNCLVLFTLQNIFLISNFLSKQSTYQLLLLTV